MFSLLSSGKYDIAPVRLLEYWRSKNPENATYKQLYGALKRAGHETLSENVYNASPNDFSREVLPRPQPSHRYYSPSPTLEAVTSTKHFLPEKSSSDAEFHSAGESEKEDDITSYSVSPVPSNDPITPLTSPSPHPDNESDHSDLDELEEDRPSSVIENRSSISPAQLTLTTGVNEENLLENRHEKFKITTNEQDNNERDTPEVNLDVNENKQFEYEESPTSSSEYTRSSRWSTSATYADTDTPDDEKVPMPITPDDDGNFPQTPSSPTSMTSDLGKDDFRTLASRTESFDNRIQTPCDVSATVTPSSLSPAGDDDEEKQAFVYEQPPDINFSALGIPDDGGEPEQPTSSETHQVSPYELSLRRQQLLEDMEFEQRNADKSRDYVSKTPVNEESIADEKQGEFEAGIDFSLLEDDKDSGNDGETVIVPENVVEEEATPYFELPANERVSYDEKLIERPSYISDVQSTPFVEFSDEFEEEVSAPPNETSVTTPSTTIHADGPDENPVYSNQIPNCDSQVILNQADELERLPSPDDDGNSVVRYYDNGEVLPYHGNGGGEFSNVTRSVTVTESVSSTTETDVREVSPEELQELIAQHQQQFGNGDDNTITTTHIITHEMVASDGGDENNDETTTVVIQKSGGFVVKNDVDVTTSRTKELTEDVSVMEIELNEDERKLNGEELIEHMFGGEQNVLEFFKEKDGDDLNDVGKVDEYGTQV